MKAPAAMRAAVRNVQPSERDAARKVAETFYFSFLAQLNGFGDFTTSDNERLAAEAAAAEVVFRFS